MRAPKKTQSLETYRDFDWQDAASRLVRAEIVREGLTVRELVARLQGLGIVETEASVKNKLSRGTFSTVFLIQALQALGHSTVDLSSVLPADMPAGANLDVVLITAKSSVRRR